MGVAMTDNDLTAMAYATGVLSRAPHRPPLGHISPSAAERREECSDDAFILTWRALARAGLCILAVWAVYVAVWALVGGAA